MFIFLQREEVVTEWISQSFRSCYVWTRWEGKL